MNYESLCKGLSDCLEKAVEQLNDFGERIADNPLTADCCACIRQFQCGEEPDTPCKFKWTFTNEAEWLINKTKEMLSRE